MPELPLPPTELTKLVGHADASGFDNPTGAAEFPGINSSHVLDIGCGCGRIARRLMQQLVPPARYLGVDINKRMLYWCSHNLLRENWEFKHIDIHNRSLNPEGTLERAALPAGSDQFSLAVAWSLFTHVLERDLEYNLREAARCIWPGGVLVSTWFMFDKTSMPFMHDFQNALYINLDDPINAVVYDKEFVRGAFTRAGLSIFSVDPPAVRGHQWVLRARKAVVAPHVEFPEDAAPVGVARAPL